MKFEPQYKQLAISLASLITFFILAGCGEDKSQLNTTTIEKEQHVGKAVYDKFCKVCHAQGLNGAPILGNQTMWQSRLPKGKEVLIISATEGFGLMPANKGRDPSLDQQAISNAVDYMLSKVQ